MRNVGGGDGLLEHRHQRVLDVRRRRRRVEKACGRAILQVGGIRPVRDVGIGVAVLVIGETRVWIDDGSVWDVENGHGNSVTLHRLTIIGVVFTVGRYARRRVLIGGSPVRIPVLRAPVSARLSLVVLRAVADDEHIRQRVGGPGSSADRVNVRTHSRQRVLEVRPARSERRVHAGIQQVRQLLSEVSDCAAAEAGSQADGAGIAFVDVAGSGVAGAAHVLDEWKQSHPELIRDSGAGFRGCRLRQQRCHRIPDGIRAQLDAGRRSCGRASGHLRVVPIHRVSVGRVGGTGRERGGIGAKPRNDESLTIAAGVRVGGFPNGRRRSLG